jgi:hypothetical protein
MIEALQFRNGAASTPYERDVHAMRKTRTVIPATVMLLGLGIGVSTNAQGDGLLARFSGGIGADPLGVASVQIVSGNPDGEVSSIGGNVVRGVLSAGRIWRIGDLKADVHADGRIKVRGKGLLLASGNRIGQSANIVVFATLICDLTTFAQFSTATTGVQVDPSGDFRIDDTLYPVPSECPSPALLIRSVANGQWFAAGIARLGDDD